MGAFTDLFGASPRVAVVEAFAENPDDELSVPEIVKIADVSRGAAYTHVRRLLKEGILVESKKAGKCQYYKFNKADVRGESIVFLENILVLGNLESRIKRDEGIMSHEPFPFPRRFDPRVVLGRPLVRVTTDRLLDLGLAASQYRRMGMDGAVTREMKHEADPWFSSPTATTLGSSSSESGTETVPLPTNQITGQGGGTI